MTAAPPQVPADGRGALAWLCAAWVVLLVTLCAWRYGAFGVVVCAGALYLGGGLAAAVLLPSWRLRTFQSRHLPAESPDAPGLNVRLTSALIACLVCLLWPLYWRLSVLDEQRRRARPDPAADRNGG